MRRTCTSSLSCMFSSLSSLLTRYHGVRKGGEYEALKTCGDEPAVWTGVFVDLVAFSPATAACARMAAKERAASMLVELATPRGTGTGPVGGAVALPLSCSLDDRCPRLRACSSRSSRCTRREDERSASSIAGDFCHTKLLTPSGRCKEEMPRDG